MEQQEEKPGLRPGGRKITHHSSGIKHSFQLLLRSFPISFYIFAALFLISAA